jgi:L-methionine (R)-S-oxide reductase
LRRATSPRGSGRWSRGRGALISVLDIDSDRPAAFDEGDARALEGLMAEAFGRL